MKIIMSPLEMKKEIKKIRNQNGNIKIGFVPTMGGLHEGHLSLIKKCISENDISVVSVFLNPTQFNDKNDLISYPADKDEDIAFLEKAGIDFAFMPDYKNMYPDDYAYKVIETDFSKKLCGAKRPGHFDGVLSVVMKLFNIVQPDRAYFGEKDYQQFQLLKGMAETFFMDVELVGCPIIRESNGLAVSSRNRKLSPESLKTAPKLYETLISGHSLRKMAETLESSGFRVDYLTAKSGRLYAAAFLEGVRLIDNVSYDGEDENYE